MENQMRDTTAMFGKEAVASVEYYHRVIMKVMNTENLQLR